MYRLRKLVGKEKRIFGVVGGISKYIDADKDPAGMRILWLILCVFALPQMILLYLILAIALKPEDYDIRKVEREAEKPPETEE